MLSFLRRRKKSHTNPQSNARTPQRSHALALCFSCTSSLLHHSLLPQFSSNEFIPVPPTSIVVVVVVVLSVGAVGAVLALCLCHCATLNSTLSSLRCLICICVVT